MRTHATHRWDLSYAQARDLQQCLAKEVSLRDRILRPRRVTGVDVAYERSLNQAIAVAVTLAYPSMEVIEQSNAVREVTFPYIPGLLSFREAPVILDALAGLSEAPDLLLVDGQGIAHPRRFGIACHLGVITKIPSIGVAKSRLIGKYVEPAAEKGSWSPLIEAGEAIGRVVRSRDGVRPLFVSPGYGVGLDRAVEWVLACCSRYRLPDPTHMADRRVAEIKKARRAC